MAPALTDHPLGQCFTRRALLADEETYRFELALRYSYVLPESHLLEVISGYSPLVELGAGTGYWAYLLRSMGVDVIAYDLAPFGSSLTNRYHINFRRWTNVIQGDVTSIAQHGDRSLFLCWPPRFSALSDAIPKHNGEYVLLISDDGTRTTGTEMMSNRFCLVASYAAVVMDPAPATEAKLTVWRRSVDAQQQAMSCSLTRDAFPL